jgi:outer membrane receptor protein involved in Fe transport
MSIFAIPTFIDAAFEREQFSPKLGVSWNILTNTRLRAAVFRVLKRTFIADQTIEPTQVAGFNQFFDDVDGTESWRYGVGLDQKFTDSLFGGVELSKRDLLDVPLNITKDDIPVTIFRDWKEQLARSYLFWTAHPWLALSAEYQFERFERNRRIPGEENFLESNTHRIPFGISFFHPTGFSAQVKATYVDQEGTFGNLRGTFPSNSDQFWVLDTSIGYRLPDRWGLIQLGAKNLLAEHFRFQDTDPKNPSIIPERLIFIKYTLAY